MNVKAVQLQNAFQSKSILLTESGITRDLRDLQPQKVRSGIDDTEADRRTFDKDVPSLHTPQLASTNIVTEFRMTMEVNEEQCPKHSQLIWLSDFGRVILRKDLQL